MTVSVLASLCFTSCVFALQTSVQYKEAQSRRSQLSATTVSEVEFFSTHVGGLKLVPRTGWLNHGISPLKCESVADHSYRLAILVMLYDPDANLGKKLNISKMSQMALLHDLAESIVGDITPPADSGVSRAEKHDLEHKAMVTILATLSDKKKAEFRSLFEEYEAQVTEEAKFVKDCDRIEMCSQALEYENRENVDLTGFFTATRNKARFPQTVAWDEELFRSHELLKKGKKTEKKRNRA